MQAHTTIAAETLQNVALDYPDAGNFLRLIIDIVRHHHERWDGQGYPDGLSGEAIPLPARIVAICDVYDALRTHRSWKPALSHEVAMHMIAEASPGQFDPRLVEIFLRIADSFAAIFAEEGD